MRRILYSAILWLLATISLVAGAPLRVVSLVPSVTRNLYYLDASELLVGCTSYCMAVGQPGVTVVASAIKTSPEAIAALRPDLVLVSSLTPTTEIETMKRLGLEVVSYPTGKTLDELCDQLEDLGRRIGKGSEAKRLTGATRVLVEQITRKIKDQGLTGRSILMQLGESPLYGVTDGNYMDEMITKVGGTNICAGLTSGTLSREYVLKQDPDFIFVIGMGEERSPMIRSWRKFPSMKAVRQDHVIELDANETSQPTPITYYLSLRRMACAMGLVLE